MTPHDCGPARLTDGQLQSMSDILAGDRTAFQSTIHAIAVRLLEEVRASRASAYPPPVDPGEPTARDPFDSVAAEIAAEIRRARTKHAPMRGAHEGYAVLLEEVDELWDEVKRSKPDLAAMRKEAVQVGAMALAFALEVCDAALLSRRTETPQKETTP